MSQTALASLVVSLEANTAQFTANMERAAAQTNGAMRDITSAVGIAKGALLGLASAFTVGAATQWAQGIIASASALDDLSESTGSSVESLSRLTNQAKVAGVPFDSFSTAINKLAAGMNGVDDESTRIGKALSALGISAKDPAEAFTQIALTMDKYADGTGKAAALADLFGKNWASVMPALRAVVEQQDVQATITRQQAADAEKLEQSWRKLTTQGGLLKTMLLSEMVPALNRWIEGVQLARASGLGWFDSLDLGTTYTDKLVPRMQTLREEIDSIQKNMEQVKKQGREWFLPGLQQELDEKLKKLSALQAIMDRMYGKGGDNSGAPPAAEFKPGLAYTSTPDAKKAVDEYAKAIEAAGKAAAVAQLQLDALFDTAPITAADRALAELMASDKWKKFSDAQQFVIQGEYLYAAAIEKSAKKFADFASAAGAFATQQAREREQYAQQVEDDFLRAQDTANAAQRSNDVLERENALIGSNGLARQLLAADIEYENVIRQAGVNISEETIAKLKEELDRRKALITDGFNKTETLKALQDEADAFRRTFDTISNTITDALMRGFEHGKSFAQNFRDTVVNLFKTLVLRPVIQAIVSPVAAGLAGLGASGSASAGGFGGIGNVLSSGSSLYNLATGGLTNLATGFALSGFGQGLGLSSQLIAQAGSLSLGVETAGAAAGTMGLTAAGSALVSALPWVALAAIAVPMVIKAFDKGDAMRTGTFASNSALGPGNPLFQSSSAFGTFGVFNDKWFSNSDMGPAMQSLLATIKGLDNAIAAAVGPALTQQITAALQSGTSYQFGMEHTDLNASGVAGGILKDRYTTVLNALDAQLGPLLKSFDGTGEEMAKFVLGLIGLHKAMSDSATMVKTFGETFDIAMLQTMQRDGEAITDTFTRLANVFTATNAVAELLGKDTASAFGAIGLASTEARENLVDLAGGIDNLNSQTSFYYNNFLTDADRIALALPAVTKTMTDLGLAGVTTREQFVDVVKGLDLSTESGRAMFEALMKIAPAFLMVASATTQATEAIAVAIPRVVNGLRTMEPIPVRGAGQTPWELQGPAPTGHGALPGRGTATPNLRGESPVVAWIASIGEAATRVAELVKSNPLADALNANGSQWEKLNAQGVALDSLITFYDGSTTATEQLTQATSEYYQSLVQMIGVIEQLKVSIANMFEDSIRYYKMDGLDTAGKYQFLQSDTAALRARLATATDPAVINAITQQINANQREAYGLLTPEQRNQPGVREAFISGAEGANKEAQARLEAAEKKAEERAQALFKGIHDAIAEAIKQNLGPAAETVRAGGAAVERGGAAILAAARTPAPVRQRTPSDVNA